MVGLLLLASFLALASGLIQLLGKGRIPGTIPLTALVELLTGLVVPVLVLSRPPSTPLGTTLLTAVLGLVLFSSVTRIRRQGARRKHREETEGARLFTYVKYLSPRDGGPSEASRGRPEDS